jgi:type IV pilus assembly protein PilB
MVDMGVPNYLVASSVVAVLGQRLVRTICPRCKQVHIPRETELVEAGIPVEVAAKGGFMKGKGCNHCQRGGYRGRIGIHELMMVTGKIRELVFANKTAAEIRSVAITEGMATLYLDGLFKVMKGITTLEEVFRVAKRTEQDTHLDFTRVA